MLMTHGIVLGFGTVWVTGNAADAHDAGPVVGFVKQGVQLMLMMLAWFWSRVRLMLMMLALLLGLGDRGCS